jgi:hypothetical protein
MILTVSVNISGTFKWLVRSKHTISHYLAYTFQLFFLFFVLVFFFYYRFLFPADPRFRTGDKILLDLGIECPLPGDEARLRWHQGLQQFSEQLKMDKVHDPEEIAARLVAFRRSFLGDKSRVLNLGDVQI